MCSCNQEPPLVCMQQKGYSPKFQHQMGLFWRKGKKNLFKLTSSLPLEPVKHLDFYLSFFRFTGAQCKYLLFSSDPLLKLRF